MGQSMVGRLAIKARQIQPGDAFAAAVPAGGLVEIVDLDGRQVAELVAFDQGDPSERISLGVTRQVSKSIMLSLGMKVYSSRGRAMLDLVEDTVGRHDLLWTAPTGPLPAMEEPPGEGSDAGDDADRAVASDVTAAAAPVEIEGAEETPAPTSPAGSDSLDASAAGETLHEGDAVPLTEDDQISDVGSGDAPAGGSARSSAGSRPEPLTGFAAALEPFGLATPDVPDPINFFMQLAVMQRGDLELRAPLSERGDRVVLQALTDLVVAVRCSSVTDETNGESPSDILVRVYR